MVHGVGDGVQQLAAVLLPAQGGVEGDHIAVALLRPVVVDEPVFDGPGGVGQKGAPALLIGQHRLIEGQHGDAQLVLVAVFRGGVEKLHRLRADKAHVLTDEGVRRLRSVLADRTWETMSCSVRTIAIPPSPSGRRIRTRRRIFGVTAENFKG